MFKLLFLSFAIAFAAPHPTASAVELDSPSFERGVALRQDPVLILIAEYHALVNQLWQVTQLEFRVRAAVKQSEASRQGPEPKHIKELLMRSNTASEFANIRNLKLKLLREKSKFKAMKREVLSKRELFFIEVFENCLEVINRPYFRRLARPPIA